jgi:acetyl esterase/lipase
MIARLIGALALLAAASAVAKDAPAYETRTNIIYGSYSGLALLMDVKIPKKPNGRAILHIPGSGFQAPLGMEPWEIKNAEYHRPVEEQFLARGFTVATINHRAAPRFSYPAPFEDAQRAARFIRANAKNFRVSPDWLGVLGASSGGHLALLLGTRGEGAEKPMAGAQSRKPQCVIAVMASSDLLPLGQEGMAVGMVTQFTGTVAPWPDEAPWAGYAERLAPYVEASPINHLDGPDRPAFLLVHGDADKLVPIDQSQRFVEKAKAAGIDVEFRKMPGVGHAFPAPHPDQAAQWMADCAARRP